MTRGAARVLRYQALVDLADGRRDDALARSIDILRLARHFDEEPTLVSHLVSLAVRGMGIRTADLVLRGGPVSTASHDALEAELARHDLPAAARHALVTERPFGLGLYREMLAQH